MFGKTTDVVGLDIGSSAIKAVQLKRFGRRLRVVAYAREQLSRLAIVDGVVNDRTAVAEAIARLIGPATAFRARHVCAALAGNAVIVKRVSVEVMGEDGIQDAVRNQAGRSIPFAADDVHFDFHVVEGGAVPGSKNVEVLLVAAKRETVDEYVSLIATSSRSTAIIDVDAFALQRAYEANYRSDAASTAVLLNVGASTVTMNIVQGTESLFVRDVGIGGNAYTEALRKEFGVSHEAAEVLKQGRDAEGVTYEDVRSSVRAVSERLLGEIQQTFEFFRRTNRSKECDVIMLSGGACRLAGIDRLLEQRFSIPVEYLDPFRNIRWNTGALGERSAESSASAAVAVGLALRRVGDS